MYRSTSVFLLAALSLFNPAAAAPTAAPYSGWRDLFNSNSKPQLPSEAAPLQKPTSDVKVIALGVGIQNYTCSSPSASPTALGAVATLFDATNVMSRSGPFFELATMQMSHMADQLSNSRYNNGLGMREIGKHFFDAAGVPNFDLFGYKNMYLYAKKVGSMPAPDRAYAGRDGGKAVDWLYLAEDDTKRSKRVKSVYRVETTGGGQADCEGTTAGQVMERDYSAEYWFY